MFYSVSILTHKGGKFALVWLAAMKTRKLKRREYESVDVTKTCDDILEYLPKDQEVRELTLLADRDPKTFNDRLKARISLYLASQLLYGTIVVYGQQIKYLLGDVKQIIENIKNLMKVGRYVGIDMDKPIGRNIDLNDPTDFPFDPNVLENFGRPAYTGNLSPAIMSFGDREYLEVGTAYSGNSKETEYPRHTAPRAAITLREDDWATLASPFQQLDTEDFPVATEGEEILTEATADAINVLIAELDKPPASPIIRQRSPPSIQQNNSPGPIAMDQDMDFRPESRPIETTMDDDIVMAAQPTEETPFSAPVVPPPPAPRRMPPAEPDVTMPPKQPKSPRGPRRQPVFQLNPIEQDVFRTPHRRALAKRARLIVDRSNIINGEELNRQIDDMEGNNRTLEQVTVNILQLQKRTDNWMEVPGLAMCDQTRTLFNWNLTTRQMSGEFEDLWLATPWPIQDLAAPPRSPIMPMPLLIDEQQQQEEQQEIYPPPEPIMVEEPTIIEPEVSSAEEMRLQDEIRKRTMESQNQPLLETGETVTPIRHVTLDQAEDQFMDDLNLQPGDGEPAPKRPRVRSPAPVDHLAKCYPMPPDMPNHGAPQTFALQRDQLENHVNEMTANGRSTTFEELFPIDTTTKAQAAKAFYMILELRRARKIEFDQDEAYGTITIDKCF